MIHGVQARTHARRARCRRGLSLRLGRRHRPQPFRMPDAQEERHAPRSRPWRRRRRRARGRGSSRRGTAGRRRTSPATRIAGQTSIMPRKPAKAQTSQNGTRTEKNGSWRPDHGAQVEEVETGHALERDDGRAERAEGHGRGVGDEREARGGERREAEADEDGARHRDRRAEAGRALEERAEGEGDEQELEAPVLGDVRDALARAPRKSPRSCVNW